MAARKSVEISPEFCRQRALAAQGLLVPEPYGRGLAGAANAIAQLGYVQIDSLSVIERAHHHVIATRVPDYQPAMSNQLLKSAQAFEYWSHAAALLPMSDFRFSLPDKQAIKRGEQVWQKSPNQRLMAEVLARIAAEGPLRARDLAAQRVHYSRVGSASSASWGSTPVKKALEQLFMQGDVMIAQRHGLEKVYELSERLIPAEVDCRSPSVAEFAAHLAEQQLRCHGVVSLRGISYLRRTPGLPQAVSDWLAAELSAGRLVLVSLASGERFFAKPALLDQPLLPLSERLLILSPFDNSVIQRQRLRALFDFSYQLECYLPAVKRRYGYFCLPLLYRATFVGRMDCKAERKTATLLINSLQFEFNGFETQRVLAAFVEAIKAFCLFQRCEQIVLLNVEPQACLSPLRRELQILAKGL